jgi:hypothetical protein
MKPFKSEVIEEDSIAVVTCHNLEFAKIPQNPVLSHGLVAYRTSIHNPLAK